MPNRPGPAVATRRLDRDVVLAVVDLRELADYKARHGLRTVGGYWPSHSALPILFVEPVPADDHSQETKQ